MSSTSWNHANWLVEVVPLAPTSGGDKKVVFSYDAFGRRIRKQVFPWNDTTSSWGSAESDTKFLYDGWRVIMEFDGLNSDAITQEAHLGSGPLRLVFEGAGGIGGLLATEDTAGTASTTDDRTFIYFYDANGNVGQLIETTSGANLGTIAAHYEYGPYGERSNSPAAGEYDQPFRFSTKWFDDETGLGNWGYRHYDPDLGRWTSRDPIGERGGLNLYAYVSNNALSIIDALGHEGIKNGKWEDVFRTFQLMKKKCDKCCKCAPDKALCKKEAQRIADNIRKAVKYNSGRAQCTGKHQVEGYLCWDWSKAFEDAVKCAKTKKWSVEQVKFDCQSQDPNKEFLVHFFIRLRACGKTDDNCVVMIDDGFFSDGTYHVPPWPDDPEWVEVPFEAPDKADKNDPCGRWKYTWPEIDGCPK